MTWPGSAPFVNAVLRAGEAWAEAIDKQKEERGKPGHYLAMEAQIAAKNEVEQAVRAYVESTKQEQPPSPEKEPGD